MYAKLQETLRILLVGLSIDESDFLLNQLKEHGYNVRGSRIDSLDQLISNLDKSYNWNLLVIDQDFNNLTIDQTLKTISKRHLYIPIILLNNATDNIPYDLLGNGVRAVLSKQDKNYFANIAIKEINDFNIRKNYFLMSVALNSIEHHTHNIINRSKSALVYIIEGIIHEVNDYFLKLLKITNKQDIIGKTIIDLIKEQEIRYFVEFIEHIETASEPISVMQTIIAINNSSIPVSIVVLPTSLDGQFALCLEINKISTNKPINQLNRNIKLNSADTLLVNNKQFKQKFNAALQKALSANKYSMLSCINLGGLYKNITNDTTNNCSNILNNIAKTIKQLLLKNTIITNLENGYFMLLFNSSDKKSVKQNITDIINKLNDTEIDINDELIKIHAFAGLVVISSDSANPQELIKYVKHASVVAYINKSKIPNFYESDEKQHQSSIYKSTIKHIKLAVEQKKIKCYYQGILNTKDNNVSIYNTYSSITINQDSYTDQELELKFSDTDTWGKLDKLKIIQIVKQLTNHLAKLNSVIVSIGINSIKNIKFINWLDNLLIKAKIDTSYFIIEINEYFVIKHEKHIIRLFSELQARGYNTCIGKFGCSLNYKKIITQHAPNFIRIDGSFIESIEQDNSEDIKQILDNINSYDTEIITPNIENLKIMQKILEFEIYLLLGNYIQPSTDNIQTDLV